MWDLLSAWARNPTPGCALGRGRPTLEYLEDRCAPGSIVDLGTLGGYNSYGFAINAAGMVVGDSYTNQFNGQHAYSYGSDSGTMSDLGTLGGDSSQAMGINDPGQVVGGAITAQGIEHAFVFDGGTMVDLSTRGCS